MRRSSLGKRLFVSPSCNGFLFPISWFCNEQFLNLEKLRTMFRMSVEIVKHFQARKLSEESQSYIKTHAKRYAFLLEKVSMLAAGLNQRPPITFLDIGPSFFTELLRVSFPQDKIMTLGYDFPESRGGHFPMDTAHDNRQHFHFNLNDAQFPDRYISTPPADIAIMAEVIEHLYTAPTLVLRFVRTLIRSGGFLIVETPNPASLKKRLKLLWGKHPYEMIRENVENPGHFREYTKGELCAIAKSAGFEVSGCELSNYFSHDSSKASILRLLRSHGPSSLRRGITMILRKPV